MKKIVIFSTSLRNGSNSEILARSFAKGASEAGHAVDFVSLKEKNIGFCRGCGSCDSSGICVIRDDANTLVDKAVSADIIVLAGPMYHTNISGAMKTLLDRLTPAMARDYQFTDLYLIITAADDSENSTSDAEKTIIDWTYSFKKLNLMGVLRGQGLDGPKEANNHMSITDVAYRLGQNV